VHYGSITLHRTSEKHSIYSFVELKGYSEAFDPDRKTDHQTDYRHGDQRRNTMAANQGGIAAPPPESRKRVHRMIEATIPAPLLRAASRLLPAGVKRAVNAAIGSGGWCWTQM